MVQTLTYTAAVGSDRATRTAAYTCNHTYMSHHDISTGTFMSVCRFVLKVSLFCNYMSTPASHVYAGHTTSRRKHHHRNFRPHGRRKRGIYMGMPHTECVLACTCGQDSGTYAYTGVNIEAPRPVPQPLTMCCGTDMRANADSARFITLRSFHLVATTGYPNS